MIDRDPIPDGSTADDTALDDTGLEVFASSLPGLGPLDVHAL